MNHIEEGFNALLETQGTSWVWGGFEFRAIAQSGQFATVNFADGDPNIVILRALRSDLPLLPSKGDTIYNASGQGRLVKRARHIDETFLEIEISE